MQRGAGSKMLVCACLLCLQYCGKADVGEVANRQRPGQEMDRPRPKPDQDQTRAAHGQRMGSEVNFNAVLYSATTRMSNCRLVLMMPAA